MKSEKQISNQVAAIHRQMKRNTPGQAFAMMTQVVNALNWVLDNGNDPARALADLANFEKSLVSARHLTNGSTPCYPCVDLSIRSDHDQRRRK